MQPTRIQMIREKDNDLATVEQISVGIILFTPSTNIPKFLLLEFQIRNIHTPPHAIKSFSHDESLSRYTQTIVARLPNQIHPLLFKKTLLPHSIHTFPSLKKFFKNSQSARLGVCGPSGDLQGVQAAASVLDQLLRHLALRGHALLPEAHEAGAVGRAPVVDLVKR